MSLGRLFWKFFFAFWFAQLLTTFGVGVLIWAHRDDDRPGRDRRPITEWCPAPALGLGQAGNGEGPMPPLASSNSVPPQHIHGRGRPPRGFFPPLVPILTGSVVSVLSAALLAWYFAKPIRTLRTAFEAEANGLLDTRIGTAMGRRQDELADLGSAFDRMAERLQQLVEGQKRLLHDVSHELRSPLARLQAAGDLLQQQPERASELTERIQRDTRRIDHLVGELLTLARLDVGATSLLCEAFNIADLIDDLAADIQVEAETKACTLCLQVPEAIIVEGDLELLRRALENVLRNAVRHSPRGSPIKLKVAQVGSDVRIDISDAGPGVAEADLSAIFEPFYRAPDAKPFEGYGLGLAITKQVLSAHGGWVAATNVPTGGLRVTLSLPLAGREA